MTKFYKLDDRELCIMMDFKNRVSEYRYDDECECNESCFPHSRDVCTHCSMAIDEVSDELRQEVLDDIEMHDEREGMLDDGQMFYNHHEAKDGWFND